MITWLQRRRQIKHLLYEMYLKGRIDRETLADQFDNLNNVEPLKHGHWIEKVICSHSYAECSECKTVYSWSETETMRYCKRCGARMDEVEE